MEVANVNKLPIIEIFGPTIQGEGAVIGLKTMFVRTYGCDYRCSWCDSAFTWDGTAKSQVKLMYASDIINNLQLVGADNYQYVTISGGNPALHKDSMNELINAIHADGKKAIVETQGSLWQDWFSKVDILTISPKPPSSGMVTDWGKLDHIMSQLNPLLCNLKVVVFDDKDFEYAKQVHQKYIIFPFYLQTGNSNVTEPGDISGRLLSKLDWLFQKVLDDTEMNAVRVLPQLHTLIWHNKRGK